MVEAFPRLTNLLGAYFHQDWDLEAPTPDGVIDVYLREVGSNRALKTADEIDQLLHQARSESQVRDFVLEKTGHGYDPSLEEITAREWLAYVARRLRLAPRP